MMTGDSTTLLSFFEIPLVKKKKFCSVSLSASPQVGPAEFPVGRVKQRALDTREKDLAREKNKSKSKGLRV